MKSKNLGNGADREALWLGNTKIEKSSGWEMKWIPNYAVLDIPSSQSTEVGTTSDRRIYILFRCASFYFQDWLQKAERGGNDNMLAETSRTQVRSLPNFSSRWVLRKWSPLKFHTKLWRQRRGIHSNLSRQVWLKWLGKLHFRWDASEIEISPRFPSCY